MCHNRVLRGREMHHNCQQKKQNHRSTSLETQLHHNLNTTVVGFDNRNYHFPVLNNEPNNVNNMGVSSCIAMVLLAAVAAALVSGASVRDSVSANSTKIGGVVCEHLYPAGTHKVSFEGRYFLLLVPNRLSDTELAPVVYDVPGFSESPYYQVRLWKQENKHTKEVESDLIRFFIVYHVTCVNWQEKGLREVLVDCPQLSWVISVES